MPGGHGETVMKRRGKSQDNLKTSEVYVYRKVSRSTCRLFGSPLDETRSMHVPLRPPYPQFNAGGAEKRRWRSPFLGGCDGDEEQQATALRMCVFDRLRPFLAL